MNEVLNSLEELIILAKCELVITCVLYFDHKVMAVMSILCNKQISPFGKYSVKEYFKRIEFQHTVKVLALTFVLAQ